MIEEPMSIVLNVAMGGRWCARPKYNDQPCRGDGSDPKNNKICDAYPLFLKIDYLRLYQDLREDRPVDDLMQLGCDPKTHPTREWIRGHAKEYADNDNPIKDVQGGAFCRTDADCTLDTANTTQQPTGKCVRRRCKCNSPKWWGGPRCTTLLTATTEATQSSISVGPSLVIALVLGIAAAFLMAIFISRARRKARLAGYYASLNDLTQL